MSKSLSKTLTINGLKINATFYTNDIDNIFMPILKKLTKLQKEKDERIIVFIAAAPGTGKSTLVTYLEDLSNEDNDLTPIQAIGIDGFHYPNSYLNTHFLNNKPLMSIKGSPLTYDVAKLKDFLINLKSKDIVSPIYSRITHDVKEDGILITKDIVLIEGNYLLLDYGNWNELSELADFTIFIKAKKEMLKRNSIQRKIYGGSSKDIAINHYLNVDSINIDTVLNHSKKADITLSVTDNNRYYYE